MVECVVDKLIIGRSNNASRVFAKSTHTLVCHYFTRKKMEKSINSSNSYAKTITVKPCYNEHDWDQPFLIVIAVMRYICVLK